MIARQSSFALKAVARDGTPICLCFLMFILARILSFHLVHACDGTIYG